MPYLDHIIILIPYSSLLSLPAWIPRNFTLTPGGTHSDGKTANRLVVFQDGSYLEFISFVDDDPANRAGHCWGNRKFGIIDFALTGNDAQVNWEGVNERLEKVKTGVRYDRPRAGGRRRPDGQEVKWLVTWPKDNVQRGEVPFFCHDVTDRDLRVPIHEGNDGNVRHPSGAFGMTELHIYVTNKRAAFLAQVLEAVLNTPNLKGDAGEKGVEGIFEVGRLRNVPSAEPVRIIVGWPSAGDEGRQEEVEKKGGVAIGDLIIWVRATAGDEDVGRIDVPNEDGVGGVFLELGVSEG